MSVVCSHATPTSEALPISVPRHLLSRVLLLAALVGLAMSADAARRADLSVTIVGPSTLDFGQDGTYSVITNNSGERNARDVQVTIDIPADMSLVTASSDCTATASGLDCDLGRVRRGRSATVSLQLTAPASTGIRVLSAQATTSSREHTANNNSASVAVDVLDPTPPPPPAAPVAAPVNFEMHMCVSLSAPITWADCTPGSLLSHTVTLEPNNSVTTYDPGVYGFWSQSPTATDLTMDFFNQLTNDPMSTMTGTSVTATCFEGTTTYQQGSGFGAWRGCFQ